MGALTVTAANVSANQNQGSIINNYEAVSAVNVGDCVYVTAAGKVAPAVGNVLIQNARAIGIVVDSQDLYGATAIAAGKRCSVCTFGPVEGFSGMNPGQSAWVSKTVAGGLDDTAPTAGVFQFIVGRALSATTFMVDPGESAPASV